LSIFTSNFNVMKTRCLSFFLILSLFASTTYASHYMGGEITWQCLGNGNYRFIMKLYRECNGTTYNNSESIIVGGNPFITSITMNLKPGANPHDIDDGVSDGKTDLSPHCWSNMLALHCALTSGADNSGAIEEWYYTSDVSYPDGVQLVGVPPATGWVFSYSSCCRNPSSNLVNPTSADWFLKSVMYPNNGQNGFPCYDNAPVFAESPSPVICSGSLYISNNGAIDPDNDSLVYQWAPALSTGSSTLLNYMPGYTYTSPFPSSIQNPLNVAAYLNPHNGELSYTSYTNGAFLSVIKATEYRGGIKIGEVFREFQSIIVPCPGNNAPVVDDPFIDTVSGQMTNTDTVNLGDIVDFNLSGIDNDTLPNGNPQTVTLYATGNDFGLGFVNPYIGCMTPPCASLTPPPVITAMLAVATHFHWQTSCSHMTNYVTDNDFAYSTHDFYFQVCDNSCPVPACLYKNVTVVIRTPLIKPVVNNVTATDIEISWNAYTGFSGPYYIYRSVDNGPFSLIDSTNNTNYTDSISMASQVVEYKIEVRMGYCHWWSQVCSAASWIGIQNNDYDKAISVFPNPAGDELSLRILSGERETIGVVILNSMGEEAGHYAFRLNQNENTFKIPTAELSSGLYLIKLTSTDLNKLVKVIISH